MNHKKIFRLVTSLFLALAVMFAGVTPALAAPVILDTSFDTDGIVTTNFGNFSYGFAVTLQPNGKIIVAGACSCGSNDDDFALARYNSNGSLDTSFSTDGKVTTPIGSGNDYVRAVALQSDGKIVVAGTSFNGSNDDFALARYNSNGSLDTTFDTDGKVTTNFTAGPFPSNDRGTGLAIQSDGKIVLAGYSDGQFALARYNSNGSLDTTFSTDGKVTTAIGSGDLGFAVALQPDGKIVVAGASYNGIEDDFALARYNSNGSLDTTFDNDGKVTTHFGSVDNGRALAIQPDGKIVVGGFTVKSMTNNDFALARYNSNGSLDTTFDTDGKVTSEFGNSEFASAMALQSDGKIVVAGTNHDSINYVSDIVLARYNSNGSLDTTFDTDGKVTTSIGNELDFGRAVAIQSDGKIIVAGEVNDVNQDDFALVRFNVAKSSTLKSVGAEDGWILESTDTSSAGGTLNRVATTFNLGDDAANKQYRAILSFNTSSLPDKAVILKVILKVKQSNVSSGGDPLSLFQGFMVDIQKGTFGTSALELGDFNAVASKTYGPFSPSLSSGWYSINLTGGKAYISKVGHTQFRLRFNLDDNNNNVSNFLKLYSGNTVAASDRPRLIIEHYAP